MKYKNFEKIISTTRMSRYLNACNGNKRKAMKLYRENLKLSQQLFTIISCFEIALRNSIDKELTHALGKDWLRDAVLPGGIFDNHSTERSKKTISKAYSGLSTSYTHFKLIAEMEFGIWKYMFSNPQFRATGQCLLNIFPHKPTSSASCQYNHSYIFKELDGINRLRNRIAHHEPIYFKPSSDEVNLTYVNLQYDRIKKLLKWMDIDFDSLVYGLDHFSKCCNIINNILQ